MAIRKAGQTMAPYETGGGCSWNWNRIRDPFISNNKQTDIQGPFYRAKLLHNSVYTCVFICLL